MEYKIYISGKITGLSHEKALANFKNAEDEILKKQIIIPAVSAKNTSLSFVNPMTLNHKPNSEWEDYMITDIAELFKCDAIYMLENWRESKGARIEYHIAREMGMNIIYQGQIQAIVIDVSKKN